MLLLCDWVCFFFFFCLFHLPTNNVHQNSVWLILSRGNFLKSILLRILFWKSISLFFNNVNKYLFFFSCNLGLLGSRSFLSSNLRPQLPLFLQNALWWPQTSTSYVLPPRCPSYYFLQSSFPPSDELNHLGHLTPINPTRLSSSKSFLYS